MLLNVGLPKPVLLNVAASQPEIFGVITDYPAKGGEAFSVTAFRAKGSAS